MAARLPKSTPSADLWQSCSELTRAVGWRPASTGTEKFSHERIVTWARYPYCYFLHEYAKKRWLGQRFVTVMFELDSLSAKAEETGLHTYSRYYIIGGSLCAAVHSQVSLPKDMSEQERKEMEVSIKFTEENYLFVPGAEDAIEVEAALREASLDGVAPYEK